MSDFDAMVADYLAAWNETDPEVRASAIGRLFTTDVRYTDPLAEVTGREALSALIGAVHQQFPGFVFAPAGPIDAHHSQVRFTWSLGPPGADAVVIGFDVAELADDGRIRLVLGFLDRVPGA